MKKTKLISVILSAMVLFSNTALAKTEEVNNEYDRFEAISNYAANLYIDDSLTADDIMNAGLKEALKDNPELMTQLIKAELKSLDDYSEYYTADEYELFNANLNHIVYGIGVIIQQVDDYVTVMTVLSGGGAEAAGVEIGDKIAKVDGVDVKGVTVDKVQDLVVGEIDTDVTVTFLRDEKEFTCTITRKEVKGTTVSSMILDGNIGYISIVNFAGSTYDEMTAVLQEFDKENVKKIIIDLRDNPGGYLDAAVNIASYFVPKGLIVSTVYRSEWENETYYSDLEKTKYDLCVLVNENTASAAEVLSSAIQDSKAGIIVGHKTYGKGVIQQMYKLSDGCAFKITTGKYFTRNGVDINGNGIEPNEYIDNSTKRIDLSKYQTFDYKNKPSVGMSSLNVKAAKERLRALGYYFGAVDEVFDTILEKAITDFQADNELFPYGVLDISTQVKIENLFYKLEEPVDDQLIYAYEYFGGNKDNLYMTQE